MLGKPQAGNQRKERLLGVARVALRPGAFVIGVLVAATVALLVSSLSFEDTFPPVKYFSYLFSTYTLVAVVVATPEAASKAKAHIVASVPYRSAIMTMESHEATRKWLHDQAFRDLVGLCPSTALSVLFVFVNLTSSLLAGSAWFASLAAYYLALASMKTVLVATSIRQSPPERKRESCRAVGILLAVLSLVLFAMLHVMVCEVVTIMMHPYLLYLNAGYVLLQVGIAIANVVRWRRSGPLRAAIKAVNLTGALVSILILQTTMITVFGGGDPVFLKTMATVTGIAVALSTIGLSVWLLAKSRRQTDI